MTNYFLAGVVLLSVAAMVPSVDAGHGTGYCTSSYGSCEFVCHVGAFLYVKATASEGSTAYANAECGGVSVSCYAEGACRARSESRVAYESVGECRLAFMTYTATCDSDAVGRWSGESMAAGDPVYTPALAKVCSPNGLVCIGPVDPLFITSMPVDVPSWELGQAHHYEFYPDARLVFIQSGPMPILRYPIPITLCDSPCTTPWVQYENRPSIGVYVGVGSSGQWYTIL